MLPFQLLLIWNCRRALLKSDSAWVKVNECVGTWGMAVCHKLTNPRLVIAGIKNIKISLKTFEKKKFFFVWRVIKNKNLLPNVFLFSFFFFFAGGLCWVFVSVRGLSLVAASGGHSSSWCAGLSLSRPLLLRSTGSRRAGSAVVAHGRSCSAACGISQTRARTRVPCIGRQILNPCTTREAPKCFSYLFI